MGLPQEQATLETERLASQLFDAAIDIIDEKYGKGYAMKNPVLLSSVVTMHETIYISTINSYSQ